MVTRFFDRESHEEDMNMEIDDILTDAQRRAARSAINDWIKIELESQARNVVQEEVRRYLNTKEVRDDMKEEIKKAVMAKIPSMVKRFTQGLTIERTYYLKF